MTLDPNGKEKLLTYLHAGSQNGRSALVNLTVHMPGDEENIISMEEFEPLL
jgi:hypothetical protein